MRAACIMYTQKTMSLQTACLQCPAEDLPISALRFEWFTHFDLQNFDFRVVFFKVLIFTLVIFKVASPLFFQLQTLMFRISSFKLSQFQGSNIWMLMTSIVITFFSAFFAIRLLSFILVHISFFKHIFSKC